MFYLGAVIDWDHCSVMVLMDVRTRNGTDPYLIFMHIHNMIGFRNIAVHDYQALSLEILQAILEKHIDDFKKFTKAILQWTNNLFT